MRVFPHMLLYGPPGVGKTALANVVARLINLNMNGIVYHELTAINLDKSTIYDFIENLSHSENKNCVVFVDEIHGLDRVVEEAMYSLLQDFKCVDQYGTMRQFEPFTIIGATTLLGEINKPFLDRFPIIIELDPLSNKELEEVVLSKNTNIDKYIGQHNAMRIILVHLNNMTVENNCIIPEWVAEIIAQRALGNPRIALQITKHIQALINTHDIIDVWDVEEFFNLLGIDEYGLHKSDRRVIQTLLSRENKPIGVTALACSSKVSKTDLEIIIEPRLEYVGFLDRTPRGRILTDKAIKIYAKRD